MSNLSKLKSLTPPASVIAQVGSRAKARRRALGMTQEQLASRSGVSLGSLRRFEQTGQVSLESLVRVARALSCEDEIASLFAKPAYRTIRDVIDEQGKLSR